MKRAFGLGFFCALGATVLWATVLNAIEPFVLTGAAHHERGMRALAQLEAVQQQQSGKRKVSDGPAQVPEDWDSIVREIHEHPEQKAYLQVLDQESIYSGIPKVTPRGDAVIVESGDLRHCIRASHISVVSFGIERPPAQGE